MKQRTLLCLSTLVFAAPSLAMAEVALYGKANVTYENIDKSDVSVRELNSNASRLGFKGSEKVRDGLEAIYQLEYEVNVDRGAKDVSAFSQRNIFIGLKGSGGQVIAGYFDTPLKTSQNKVDLFNDLKGDIKSLISPNELRRSNSVMYSSPSLGGVVTHVAVMSAEQENVDDGKSIAVTYTQGDLYLALAMERDVFAEYAEALRAVAQYKISQIQLGVLYEQHKTAVLDQEAGWMVSALYDLKNSWFLKAQYGTSDIGVAYDATKKGALSDSNAVYSLGVDYKLSGNTTLFGFYTDESAEDAVAGITKDVMDNSYLGLGMDFKF